jgi:hypothetical protein
MSAVFSIHVHEDNSVSISLSTDQTPETIIHGTTNDPLIHDIVENLCENLNTIIKNKDLYQL